MKVISIMEDLIVRAASGQGDRPAGNCPIQFETAYVGLKVIEETTLLKCFQVGKQIFVACRRLDGEEYWPTWSKVRIASISYFGVEIKQVLEVLGKCLLKSGSTMLFMLQDRISVVYS